jgi:8-oxo-dGTP pyrophosphatase MutT (NUDIX family)
LTFKEWVDEPVVSFDFDGVLHIDVYPGTPDPINWEDADLSPNYRIHKILKNEAKTNKIVVVTARCDNHKSIIWEFIRNYNLPIEEVYATCGYPKKDILQKIGAIKHYDDKDMTYELEGSGVDFIHVDPFEENSNNALVATSKTIADRGLHRQQNYRKPKLKKKRDKVDKLFGESKECKAAGIFFTDGNHVLLLRRADKVLTGYWGLPGGHAEEGETPRQTAFREVEEETGRKPGGYKFGELSKSDRWTCFFHRIDKRFPCELSDEHDAWEWIKFDELDDYKLHPMFKRAKSEYVKFVKDNF